MSEFKFKRGSATEWETKNPTLLQGEPGFDYTNNVLKIGTGDKSWTALSGILSGESASNAAVQPSGNTVTVNGTQNDYLPPVEADSIRFVTTGALLTFTGFDTSYAETKLDIINEGPNDICLKHNNTGSSANNRLYTASGDDIRIYKGDTATIIYDATISRWVTRASGSRITIRPITQSDYDALSTKDGNTLYVITES